MSTDPTPPKALSTPPDEPEPSTTLRERARSSAEEFQRTAVAISTGSLGVFFLALTQKVDPPLTHDEQWLLLAAITCMAVASVSSVFSWFADAREPAARADAIEAATATARDQAEQRKRRWSAIDTVTGIVYAGFLLPGFVTAAIYMWLRI